MTVSQESLGKVVSTLVSQLFTRADGIEKPGIASHTGGIWWPPAITAEVTMD